MVLSSRVTTSQRSAPFRMPSGRNSFAPHMQLISSSTLPATSISLASLRGNWAILALFGGSSAAHSFAALRPASSLSNIKTTVSNLLSHSRDSWMSLFAPAAPRLMLTQGHLLPIACDRLKASSSPSVMVTILPPSRHRLCPYRPACLLSPRNKKSLLGKRSF